MTEDERLAYVGWRIIIEGAERHLLLVDELARLPEEEIEMAATLLASLSETIEELFSEKPGAGR